MTELKPCPFCGSEDVHTAFYHFDDTGSKAVVECRNCYCSSGHYNDLQNAVKQWNTRIKAPELKPCPFCGGAPKIEVYKWDGDNTPDDEIQFFVRCSHCLCTSVSSNDINELFLAWNNRNDF